MKAGKQLVTIIISLLPHEKDQRMVGMVGSSIELLTASSRCCSRIDFLALSLSTNPPI